MPVERMDPSRCAVEAGPDAEKRIRQHVESDFKIRSGLCPNGCGLMTENSYGQECPACSFSCNTKAEAPRNG